MDFNNIIKICSLMEETSKKGDAIWFAIACFLMFMIGIYAILGICTHIQEINESNKEDKTKKQIPISLVVVLSIVVIIFSCSTIYKTAFRAGERAGQELTYGSRYDKGVTTASKKNIQTTGAQNAYGNTSKTSDNQSTTVYKTRTGECYHRAGCSYLKSRIQTTVSKAKKSGLRPCSRCNPPT